MEYLLVMSLSGSIMTGICLLLRHLVKDKVSARLYYLLVKAALLYYLIPLLFLKGWYKAAMRYIMPEKPMGISRIPLTWTNYVISADGKKYFNDYAVLQTATAVVWLAVICFLLARMLVDYVRTSRVIARYADRSMTDRQKVFLAGLKRRYGVKRQVSLSCGYAGADTMTFGIRRPVIICDKDVDSMAAELLVSHEMVHIRYLDVVWKILMQFAVILHWWNPITRILQHELEFVCECSCDERVLQGRKEEEIREYRSLMIREALAQTETKKTPLRWKVSFGDQQSEIKERMDNLIRKKRWNRFVAGALAAALIFANSMTVFAYRDTFHETAPEGISQEEIEKALESDTFLFVPDGTSEEERQKYTMLQEPEIRYDIQFTDEAGNIYPITEEENASVYGSCSHTYVSGTATKRNKNADGSCELKMYSAQKCSKCGNMVWGEVINVLHIKYARTDSELPK